MARGRGAPCPGSIFLFEGPSQGLQRNYGGQADSLEFRRDGGFHGRHFGSGVGGFGGLVEAGAVMVVTVSLEVGDWVAWVTFAI